MAQMATADLIVVGGGPAGMMAAGRAAERGRRALLLERGPTPGRKLLLTATGRCNITNSAPVPEFLAAFGRHGGFLRPALTRFGASELLGWLHRSGVPTVEERKGRVFPASQSARSILDALLQYLAAGPVTLACEQRVESLWLDQGRLRGVIVGGRQHAAAAVVLATGGLSYPGTGSTGDGYTLARQAGHSIVETFPALVALETEEAWPESAQGTPIKNVRITARCPDGAMAEVYGEALWTHFGLSGPGILEISRPVVLARRAGQPVTLELDLRPHDPPAALQERLLHAIKRQGKAQIGTIVAGWVAQRTAQIVLRLAGVEPGTRMNQCSRSERRRIVETVKRLTLHVARPRPIREAVVTGGGVALAEVDASTMASRLLPGLYFAGELLDLDGPSGGFNLQAAFSTGYLAGDSIGALGAGAAAEGIASPAAMP